MVADNDQRRTLTSGARELGERGVNHTMRGFCHGGGRCGWRSGGGIGTAAAAAATRWRVAGAKREQIEERAASGRKAARRRRKCAAAARGERGRPIDRANLDLAALRNELWHPAQLQSRLQLALDRSRSSCSCSCGQWRIDPKRMSTAIFCVGASSRAAPASRRLASPFQWWSRPTESQYPSSRCRSRCCSRRPRSSGWTVAAAV